MPLYVLMFAEVDGFTEYPRSYFGSDPKNGVTDDVVFTHSVDEAAKFRSASDAAGFREGHQQRSRGAMLRLTEPVLLTEAQHWESGMRPAWETEVDGPEPPKHSASGKWTLEYQLADEKWVPSRLSVVLKGPLTRTEADAVITSRQPHDRKFYRVVPYREDGKP